MSATSVNLRYSARLSKLVQVYLSYPGKPRDAPQMAVGAVLAWQRVLGSVRLLAFRWGSHQWARVVLCLDGLHFPCEERVHLWTTLSNGEGKKSIELEKYEMNSSVLWGMGSVLFQSRMKILSVIWLILPVVICLSQRLSHACLSTSLIKVKPRMAH